MININKRLSLCADFVGGKGIAVDVGTDHAYLASYLVLSNICEEVIACDINDGPLETAKQTLVRYGIEDKVMLIKSDGLKNVPDENVTDVIIAGMGGELISHIIGGADWLNRGTNLVLQPMTKAKLLRKWLYKNGFKIIKEQAVEDDNRIYTVINSVFGGEFSEIDDYFAETGLLDVRDELSRKYLLRQAYRLEKSANQMLKSKSQLKNAESMLNLSRRILNRLGELQ